MFCWCICCGLILFLVLIFFKPVKFFKRFFFINCLKRDFFLLGVVKKKQGLGFLGGLKKRTRQKKASLLFFPFLPSTSPTPP